MPTLTGGEIVARTLTNYGVKYAAGIPGHGVWALLDGFLRDESDVEVLQVFHEQSAAHLADGYYRASGKPIAKGDAVELRMSSRVYCRNPR